MVSGSRFCAYVPEIYHLKSSSKLSSKHDSKKNSWRYNERKVLIRYLTIISEYSKMIVFRENDELLKFLSVCLVLRRENETQLYSEKLCRLSNFYLFVAFLLLAVWNFMLFFVFENETGKRTKREQIVSNKIMLNRSPK